MRHPVYPEYKESGVQWLGQVPGHWDTVSLKWISQRYAGGTPDKSNDAYWEDGDIPWLNSGSVNDGYITEPSAFITREGFANSSAKWIPENALVMALAGQGKTKGMVAQLGIPATCNQSMAAIIPKEKFSPRFLYWWLVSNYQNIRNMAGGEQRDGLNLDMLGSIPCPFLPLPEQTAIVDFLDRETGRIDTLVMKKRRLIALLGEKRTALISRTVTRGLPAEAAREFGLEPHTRFKDSGIEWLGEVPEGWEVVPLFRIAETIQTGPFGSQLHSADYVEGGIPLINPAHISAGKVVPDELSSVDEATAIRLSRHRLREGDIVMGRRGEIGRCAVIGSKEIGWLCGTGSLVIRLRNSSAAYFASVISGAGFSSLLELNAVGTTMLNLNPTIVGRMLVPVPLLLEQTAIATYLDRETAKIDQLVEKVEAAIARLQEYRTALITAAVTGKIDVREAVA